MAFARVELDYPKANPPAANPFFKKAPAATPFSVPPSKAFFTELRRCCADPWALAHHGKDSKALSAMRGAKQHGLDHMPKVDECIAKLMLSPDEALKDDSRPQCRAQDELLSWAYDTAVRIGNSFLVLKLAQNRMLHPEHADLDLCNASLQAFAFMTRELGRLMSTLVEIRHQVWLAQAPMSNS